MLDVVFLFNAFEIVLWTIAGCLVLARPARHVPWLSISFPAGLAFFVFAWSDYIETQSGAWWTPWWLLPVKASCVFALVVCFARYRQCVIARRISESGSPERDFPNTQS